MENQSGCQIKTLQTDRDNEFISKEFNTFCEEHGVRRELATPNKPEHNGVVDRKNRTIIEMGRCMMKARMVPKKFWAETVAIAVYLLNLSPTKAVHNRTPYETWRDNKP